MLSLVNEKNEYTWSNKSDDSSKIPVETSEAYSIHKVTKNALQTKNVLFFFNNKIRWNQINSMKKGSDTNAILNRKNECNA